jgi:hypothetical protein
MAMAMETEKATAMEMLAVEPHPFEPRSYEQPATVRRKAPTGKEQPILHLSFSICHFRTSMVSNEK